jgi:hypothetical protein
MIVARKRKQVSQKIGELIVKYEPDFHTSASDFSSSPEEKKEEKSEITFINDNQVMEDDADWESRGVTLRKKSTKVEEEDDWENRGVTLRRKSAPKQPKSSAMNMFPGGGNPSMMFPGGGMNPSMMIPMMNPSMMNPSMMNPSMMNPSMMFPPPPSTAPNQKPQLITLIDDLKEKTKHDTRLAVNGEMNNPFLMNQYMMMQYYMMNGGMPMGMTGMGVPGMNNMSMPMNNMSMPMNNMSMPMNNMHKNPGMLQDRTSIRPSTSAGESKKSNKHRTLIQIEEENSKVKHVQAAGKNPFNSYEPKKAIEKAGGAPAQLSYLKQKGIPLIQAIEGKPIPPLEEFMPRRDSDIESPSYDQDESDEE